MTKQEALKIILNQMPIVSQHLEQGTSDGSFPDWGYDSELIIAIAEAVIKWQQRMPKIQDAYVVWICQEGKFEKYTEDMYQEDAYRKWYSLTKGGKINCKETDSLRYILNPSTWKPTEDELEEEQEDDFSIRYLLSKSFGE